MIHPEGTVAAPLPDATTLLTREAGFAPCLSSDRRGWKDIRLCKWEGSNPSVWYPPFRELILIFQSGSDRMRARRDGRWLDHASVRGRITVVPPGTPLDWQVDGRIDSWTLQIPAQGFDGLLDDASGERLMQQIRFDFASDDPLLRSSLDALGRELQQPHGFGRQYATAIADTIKLHLLRHASAVVELPVRRLPCGVLDRVLERIAGSIEGGVTLDELAQLSGRGRSQFTAAFRASMGCSPLQHLRQLRIDGAKQRLACSRAPLVEIALALGFASQAHFSACFRQAVGMTPSRYRQSVR